MTKSTLIHLRFPFSFFLMPVFLFAWATSGGVFDGQLGIVFVILHLMLYPASNGYNSYFDNDEGSIGGVKDPPKVQKELYWASLALDILALIIGCLMSWLFALMLLVYGLVSKAYSHPSVRLKRKPVLGWLSVGVFQGYWTFLMSIVVLLNLSISDLFVLKYQVPAVLSSALLLGSYPMTQIYQHEEDASRGDKTISLSLGVTGTFAFTAISFAAAMAGYTYYFYHVYGIMTSIVFHLALFPVLLFFAEWFFKSLNDPGRVNYDNTMKLNLISSTMLNLFFAYLSFS